MKSHPLIFATILFLTISCQAEEKQRPVEILKSPPFIVIDLDRDGVDLIPLKNSSAYYDMDGDGEKERIAWIEQDDTFLMFFTRQENLNIKDTEERIRTFSTGGFAKIILHDTNNDFYFNDADKVHSHTNVSFLPLNFGYTQIVGPDGALENEQPLSDFCDFTGITLRTPAWRMFSPQQNPPDGLLQCQGQAYPLYEVQFEYEEQVR